MAKTDVGDFRLKLILDADKNSFDAGQKLVGGMTDSFNQLIGVARNAAVVIAAQKAITGAINQSNESLNKIHQADIIGTSAENLNMWRAAAKIAGADANGLINSMSRLANVMNHITIDGSGLEAYSTQLAELGLGINDLLDLDPSKAMEKIFETAQRKLDGTDKTKLRMTTIIGDILGDAGQELFVELTRNNQSIASWLAGASATQYQTNEGMEASAKFATEVNKLAATAESIKNSIGDELAKALTEPAKKLNEWLGKNDGDIKSVIEKIGTGTEKIVTKVADWWGTHGDEILSVLQGIFGVTNFILGKLVNNKVMKKLTDYYYDSMGSTGDALINAIETLKNGGTVTEAVMDFIQDGIIAAPYRFFTGLFSKNSYNPTSAPKEDFGNWWEMNDGIMRPDGTITKVAPDDWVFAARNVSDLAKAFMPAGMATGGGNVEYSIVQNFTVTGATDIPQVIKQQAYRGTQEGLLALMDQSSRRLQMMSGTR